MAKAYISVAGNTETIIYDRILLGSEELIIQSAENYSDNYTSSIKSIRICNTHATDSVSIDLAIHYQDIGNAEYLESQRKILEGTAIPGFNDWTPVELTTTTYMLLNNVAIPNGVTLVLDEKDIAYDVLLHYLTIQLSAGDSAVDIIIN